MAGQAPPQPRTKGAPLAASGPRAAPGLLRSLGVVLVPFALSRGLLVLFAHSARMFPPRTDFVGRTWWFVPAHLLDVWGRWDTEWYVRIVLEGYPRRPPAGMSALAFYPLFPGLVSLVHAVVPAAAQGVPAVLVIGTLLANVFAIVGLAVLHHDVRSRLGGEMAWRTLVALLAFPSAFVLSCMYTESLFLLLTVVAWSCAWRGRWACAGAALALAALTRPTGVFVAPVLLVVALEAQDRRRALPRAALAAAMAPLAWLLFQAWCWWITGDPLATLHAQRYWLKSWSWPWQTLFTGRGGNFATDIDVVLVLVAIGVALSALRHRRWRADGAFVLAILASFLFTGVLFSASRYLLGAFPLFILAAHFTRRRAVERAYLAVALPVQALYWIAWTRMYRVF